MEERIEPVLLTQASFLRYLFFTSLQTTLYLAVSLCLLVLYPPFDLAMLLIYLMVWLVLRVAFGYAAFVDAQKFRRQEYLSRDSYFVFHRFLLLISAMLGVLIVSKFSDNVFIWIMGAVLIWLVAKKWVIPKLNSGIYRFLQTHITYDDNNIPKSVERKGLFVIGYATIIPSLWMAFAVFLGKTSSLFVSVGWEERISLFVFLFVLYITPCAFRFIFLSRPLRNLIFWLGLALSFAFQVFNISFFGDNLSTAEPILLATLASLATLVWSLESQLFRVL